jgi:hypothetical protein
MSFGWRFLAPAGSSGTEKVRRNFMLKINYRAVVVAALAAFVMSSLYYSPLLVGNLWRDVDPGPTGGTTPSRWKVVGEIVRTLLITSVLARLVLSS